MDVEFIQAKQCSYVKGRAGKTLLNNEEDLLDLICFCGERDAGRVLLFADNLPEKSSK